MASREIIQVSAGLGSDGGGTAVMARLIATTAGEFARSVNMRFRILSLADEGEGPPGVELRSFRGNKPALLAAVWRGQARTSCAGLIFDHLGPARMQAVVPGWARAPYLVFLYGIDIWRKQSWDRARSLKRAKNVVTISEFSRNRVRETFPSLERVDLVYPALEEETPSGDAEDNILQQAGSGFLLVVGRMSTGERYKGHDQLLTAMPKLLGKLPTAKLVIVGGGDDRARLESRARAMGLVDNVYFTGFVTETTLRELYRQSAAFVMPSSEEGFGLVYLESMRAGKPCVAARGSAAEEIVVDGTTGVLVDGNEPDQIAQACTRLLSDSAYSRRLGEQGYRRWQEKFSRHHFHEALLSRLATLTGAVTRDCPESFSKPDDVRY